jgi:hypothetical protein
MSAATYRALSKRLREHVNASAGFTRAWCIPGEGFGVSYYNVLMRNGTQTTLSLRGKAGRESHDSLQTIREEQTLPATQLRPKDGAHH